MNKFLAMLIILLVPILAFADSASDVDKNIKIIFPPELMQHMIDQTTPNLMNNLKFNDANDRSNTQDSTNQFHKEFLQKFQTLVAASLKKDFTPQEIAQWAAFQQTPLGKKTMNWLKTKYPDILNKSMDDAMQNLYKNLGGQ